MMTQAMAPRIFLVVSDESPEMIAAIDYAAHRAASSGGRVAIFHAIEQHEIFPWRMIEQRIDAEEELEARKALYLHEEKIEKITGQKPLFYIRHGSRQEALLQLLEQDKSISLLVLGAGTSKEGPGPLINFLTSTKGLQRLKIPFVVVPPGYVTEQT